MKKEIKIAALIFIGFLALLYVEKPLKEWLISAFQFEYLIAKLSSGIIIRIVLISIAILLIKRLGFEKFTGLNAINKFKNIHAIIIPMVFIFMGLFSNWTTFYNTQLFPLILFAVSVLAVGILEEFVFRGAIFPLCIQALKDYQRPILMGAILSSSLFGLIHLVNLFSQPDNVVGIISQMFFALAMGVFFCGLMIRTENILIPSLFHAFVNFSFGSGELTATAADVAEVVTSNESVGVNWGSVIPTTIFFAFIMAGGIYMIVNSDKSMLQKLEESV